MAKTRSYKLLCPIARGLDRIGDRWTLLILRDLHAGPARFTELQKGPTGIAANLLTERLSKLTDDGLIKRSEAAHGVTVYELTSLGASTSNIILELALFGAKFPAEGPTVRPGNLRTVATTIGAVADKVVSDHMSFVALLDVDGESIVLSVGNGRARACYGSDASADVILSTRYEALLAVSEGEMSLEVFASQHSKLETLDERAGQEFLHLMSAIIDEFQAN